MELLTGSRRSEALFWLTRKRYSAAKLENFIKNMEAARAARQEAEA